MAMKVICDERVIQQSTRQDKVCENEKGRSEDINNVIVVESMGETEISLNNHHTGQ
jgi:hypothetical protein